MKQTAGLAVLIAYLSACGESTSEPAAPEPAVVTTVLVTTPSASIFRTDTVRLTATVQDQHGADLPGIRVTWSSSNLLVAAVDSTGRVVGLAAGQVSITATAAGKSGTAQLSVVGPGTEGAVAGSALVGAAGGSVQATLPGGGGLALTIPAGSLDSTVQISLDPLVPGVGAQASFQILPAGLQLNHPVTLVVRVSPGARVRPTTVLVFEQDGLRVPVPSLANPADGTVTATFSQLGLPEPSTPALRASGDLALLLPGGMGSLLDLTVDQMLDDAEAALGQLKVLGTLPAADAMLLSMQAVVQGGGGSSPRFSTLQLGWRTEVCNARDFAVNALESFGGASNYLGLQRVVKDVIGWSRAAAEMAAALSSVSLPGCLGTPLDAGAVIKTELRRLQTAIQNDLNGFTLTPAPRDSAFLTDRLSPLLDLVAALQAAGFDAAADELITVTTGQFVRLRFIGYTECRGQQPQTVQGRLMRLEAAGGAFAAVSPFDVVDIESDIELCGMELRWRLVDSTGAVTGDGTLGGGANFGNVTLLGSGMISGPGELEVRGDLNALRCPAPASANAEQLEVVAGRTGQTLTRVAILTPSNQNTYLAVSSLRVSFDAIRSAAGIAPTDAAQATVEFRRIGEACSAQFVNLAHSSLGRLRLDAEPVPMLSITTTTLPNATVGSSYSTALQASGGSSTYQWSVVAGQLPPGLSLAPSGAITGTPSTAGTSSFTAKVVSGAHTAERAFAISVTQQPPPPPPPPGSLEWHFDTDLEGWSCNSTNNCKWQLLTSNQHPVTSGWVALQAIGSAVSRTIAIPSTARVLRFDAATHNVPGDVSRVQVQIGGVTVLDSVFTNPGSSTAFNFVTMTVDISSRAGQTVNIRFVQLDDGAGAGTTLKIDNIRIEAN